jgi:hypothetical protein
MKKTLLLLLLFVSSVNAQVFTYVADPQHVSGQPGDTFLWNITFSNPSSSSVTVRFDRYQKFNPPYWYSCFCYIQCNPPTLDYMNIDIDPNSSKMMTVLFKTDSVNPGQATASIRFFEIGFASNADTVHLTATTNLMSTGLNTNSLANTLSYPNPTKDNFTFISSESASYELMLSDINGKIVYQQKDINDKKHILKLDDKPQGQYFLKAIYSSGRTETKKIIKN